MAMLTTDTFERPADLTDAGDPRVLYAQSYLLTRILVGLIGIALPLVCTVLPHRASGPAHRLAALRDHAGASGVLARAAAAR